MTESSDRPSSSGLASQDETRHAELPEGIPELTDYFPDQSELHPYLFLHDQPNVTTPSYSTDRLGFRRGLHDEVSIDADSWGGRRHRGLFLGGSTAFGTGSSSDASTVASLLSDAVDVSFLNTAVRASCSTHQLIAALYFLPAAATVVIFTGMNNLAAALQGSLRTPFAPVYRERLISKLDDRLFGATRNARRTGSGQQTTATPEQALDYALDAHTRDLEILQRVCADDARIVFALQPVSSVAKPELTPRERRSMDLMASYRPNYRVLNDSVVRLWLRYRTRLEEICTSHGVEFFDLGSADYAGDCFVDFSHLNDRGNAAVVRYLAGQ